MKISAETTSKRPSDDVAQLNSFLRGELSAVEAYRMALDKLDDGSSARSDLEHCRKSHQRRVDMLRSTILSSGGDPEQASGAWGGMVKAVAGGAAVLGDKTAIAALEAGEDHGLADYRADSDKVHGAALELVQMKLLPLQEETHRVLSDLKKRFARSS